MGAAFELPEALFRHVHLALDLLGEQEAEAILDYCE
jgi:hypothetical protein